MFLPPSSQADEALSSRLALSQRCSGLNSTTPHSSTLPLQCWNTAPTIPERHSQSLRPGPCSELGSNFYQGWPSVPITHSTNEPNGFTQTLWGKGRHISSPQREQTCSGEAQHWPGVFVSLHSTAELIHNLIVVLWPAAT